MPFLTGTMYMIALAGPFYIMSWLPARYLVVTFGVYARAFNVDISNSGKKGPVSPAFLPELLVSTLGL